MIVRFILMTAVIMITYIWLIRPTRSKPQVLTIVKTPCLRIDTNPETGHPLMVIHSPYRETNVNHLDNEKFKSVQMNLAKKQDREGVFWFHWKAVQRFGSKHSTPIKDLPTKCPTIHLEHARFILNLGQSPSNETIQQHFRKYMQHSHPDQGGHPVLSIALNHARKLMSHQIRTRNE